MLAYRYEVFYVVANNLSFSKAASELFISQPAVSKQIKQLESETGVALFERKGNAVSLTPSGHKLLKHLQQAKFIERQIQSDFDSVKNQQTTKGELKIGASTTISLYVMPKILSAFQKKFPLIKILLLNRNSETVLNALINQEIDLACIESYHNINAVRYKPFMKDEIIPVCSGKGPFGNLEIDLVALKKFPIALRERGSGTLDSLIKAFNSHHIKLSDLNIVARLGGTEALKNYLVEAEAIGFLSRLSVRKELATGDLQELKIKSFKVMRQFNFVMRQGEESVGMLRSFIKEAQSTYS